MTPAPYPKFLGDDRYEYKFDAGRQYRTEHYAILDFNTGNSGGNQFANPQTGASSDGEVLKIGEGTSDAGYVKTNIEDGVGNINIYVDAKNKMAADFTPGGYLFGTVPNINAEVNVTITPLEDGSFDYNIDIPNVDGYPAYELWINDVDNANTYLLYGRNPEESGETPFSLFGKGEHEYEASGNSKDLISKPVETFEERKNPDSKIKG